MLAYVTIEGEDGAANRLLADLAQRLGACGHALAGAVQFNTETTQDCSCDMDLRLLGHDGPEIRISQSLGAGSQACRLDTDALGRAAGIAREVLAQGAALVIVNKFGKQECFGGGFRDLIAQALADDVPVLLAVHPEQLPGFLSFAGDMAESIPAQAAEAWCLSQLSRRAA